MTIKYDKLTINNISFEFDKFPEFFFEAFPEVEFEAFPEIEQNKIDNG